MKKLLLLTLLATTSLGGWAQKRPLEWDDIQEWNRIVSKQISNDGKYIATEIKPEAGNSTLSIYTTDGKLINSIERGSSPKILDQNIVVSTIKPNKNLVDSLKHAKAKQLPKNQLSIYNIAKDQHTAIDSLKDMKLSAKNNSWLAYRVEGNNTMTITDFGKTNVEFSDVINYKFSADEDQYILLNRFVKDSISQLIIFDLANAKVASTIELDKSQKASHFCANKSGKAAYITVGEDKSGSENAIFYWDGTASTPIDISSLESGWIVNENLQPYFADTKDRLFFGVSPQYPVEDTTIMDSKKSKVDVWIWNESVLKTQQIVNQEREDKRAYRVVYDTKTAKLTQIASLELPNNHLLLESGDSDYALVSTQKPYGVESMWTGKRRSDIYLKNIVNGEQKELFKGESAPIMVSPEANYLYWYVQSDSTWRAYSIADDRFIQLTTPDAVAAYNPSNNVPDLPVSYGTAGWSKGDERLYIYDKYDLWAIDPSGSKAPQRITDGYKEQITYRVITLDEEKKSFDKDEKLLLQLFNNSSKQSGFASMSINKPNSVKKLVAGDYQYGTPIKAKESNTILFTRENFTEFPNLYTADISFKSREVIITDANPQQSEFIWGSAEQITWISLQGDTLRGNIFKPENFDPNRKYPMICNFYERDSDNTFAHRSPTVGRSTIDYHYYTSNGYVIFNADIKYVDGYPGESCYNSLMPGITKILEMGYVDAKHIGAQGHSWGGYQTAYLATRTDLFAAIESGAPVVNMVSAYGGIRWETGLNRAFQYEKTQSRLGASPWESPSRYTENSPIYTMDKVNTPILIMHNDKDGHVPWWQGIEFFIALRRLEKPAWLLNYNDEPHWPTTIPNKMDFQVKMSQFFHHYLKGEPMPEWMVAK